jgi:hypothetical protein
MQTHDEPVLGWTLVLRRQPVHLVEGRPEGSYADSYELICCDCGDDPDLDYRDISPDFQRIRGPYRLSAGIEAYGQHGRLQHGQPPIPAASGTQQRTGSADGKTG